jgi:peptidylprolyl isomerase
MSTRAVLGWTFAATLVFASVTPASDDPKKEDEKPHITIKDVKVGEGAKPKKGDTCTIHYTGWLYEFGKKTEKFDSSVERKTPFDFRIGQGQVIKGFEEGIATMKVGGKRTIVIPPELGYGDRGVGPIPAKATLWFEVELIGIK